MEWLRIELSDPYLLNHHLVQLVSFHPYRPGHLQVTLNKLLTYCVLRPTQPPTLSGTGNA